MDDLSRGEVHLGEQRTARRAAVALKTGVGGNVPGDYAPSKGLEREVHPSSAEKDRVEKLSADSMTIAST
jgi:hypothetical protein